jgi:hypothetical protein
MAVEQELEDLRQQVALLAQQVGTLSDTSEIRALQHKYGYYLDKCLYDEVTDLFAENCSVTFLNGVYHGKESVRRLMCGWFRNYFTGGHNGPVYGFLLDHLQLQDIVTVAPDRQSAKGRFRCLMLGGVHQTRPQIPGFPSACWEAGIYENGYIREGGVWKIGTYNYNMLWQSSYGEGWDRGHVTLPALQKTYPEDPNGPDELFDTPNPVWPETRIVPFHYAHPVTGVEYRGETIGIPAPFPV